MNEADGWELAVLPPPGVLLPFMGPLCGVPRQGPVLSRPGPSLVFCLPLCSQAVLPHLYFMMGEDGRATYPGLEGDTLLVAGENCPPAQAGAGSHKLSFQMKGKAAPSPLLPPP